MVDIDLGVRHKGNINKSDNGYVYVLMNPQMENLVKIGKTTRTPAERAKEFRFRSQKNAFRVVTSRL